MALTAQAKKINATPPFTEAPAWAGVGEGWRPLHGGFRHAGYSVEWHEFSAEEDLDWSGSFHPDGLEICLNLIGPGQVQGDGHTLDLDSFTAGFYGQRAGGLTGVRRGGHRHEFLTLEFSLAFLTRQLDGLPEDSTQPLQRLLRSKRRGRPVLSQAMRLTSEQRQIVMAMRKPAVYEAARPVWYRAKALEIAATLLFQPTAADELFCERQQRMAQERAQKVASILAENLAEPPTLEELGRRVGCSPFYLSRLFTQEMGKSISAHLRDLRMERAAALLREGRMNVTEVALTVGYSSLSHFSTTFHATHGCCPGLYPLGLSSKLLATKNRPAQPPC